MTCYASNLQGWRETFGHENVLVCLYDDLERNPQGYLDSVCNFIGIPPFPLGNAAAAARPNSVPTTPRNRRLAQNARHLRDRIRRREAYWVDRTLERLGLWRLCFDGGEAFPPLAPELVARLKERFRPEVEALEQLIGRDLSAWKTGYSGSNQANAPAGA